MMSTQQKLIAASIVFLILCACGKSENKKKISWPPRSGKNDILAEAISTNSNLTLEVYDLKWIGTQDSVDGQFIPVQNEFQVTSGWLVSRLGTIEKKAKFGSWGIIYDSVEKDKAIGWGACITSGEVLTSNIFEKAVPNNNYVFDNYFEAEDFGSDYTLIKLDPLKGHKLCILIQETDRGFKFYGMRKMVDMTGSGKCSDSITNQQGIFFYNTAGCVGTSVFADIHTFVRKAAGWYIGSKKLGD